MRSRYAAPWRASFKRSLLAEGMSDAAATKATQLVDQAIEAEVAEQLAELSRRIEALEQGRPEAAEKARPARTGRDAFGRRPSNPATKSAGSGRRTPFGTRIQE